MKTIVSPEDPEKRRFSVLDGWRGVSILLVMATHLLPLGPESWQLASITGNAGMAIFFALSGFLITTTLLENDSVPQFLIRRFFRIVPLAWLSLAIILTATQKPLHFYPPNFLFYANWPPMWLARGNSHFWSLCVEVQFYLAVAVLVWMCRVRWIYLVPLWCAVITLVRIANGAYAGINTYYRIDEILSGATLALVFANKLGVSLPKFLRRISTMLCLVLFLASCWSLAGPLNYLRPYLAAVLIGSTLLGPHGRLPGMLTHRILGYIAAISYALYVIHPMLALTWLGSGEGIVKLLKRPLLFAAVFALAHMSTFYYERQWIRLGRHICVKWNKSDLEVARL